MMTKKEEKTKMIISTTYGMENITRGYMHIYMRFVILPFQYVWLVMASQLMMDD